jgi:hypothetical protein
MKNGVRTVTENIDWIVEFERLARPRLQKIFEKDLVKLPMALSERLEQLRKKGGIHERGLRGEITDEKVRVSYGRLSNISTAAFSSASDSRTPRA